MDNEDNPQERLVHTPGYITATGEEVTVMIPEKRAARRRTRRRVYGLIDLEAMARLEMTAAEYQLLFQIASHVNLETGEARVTVREIARRLGRASSNVSNTLAALRERRIVTSPRPRVHVVNPHLLYRGSNKEWDIAMESVVGEPRWRR